MLSKKQLFQIDVKFGGKVIVVRLLFVKAKYHSEITVSGIKTDVSPKSLNTYIHIVVTSTPWIVAGITTSRPQHDTSYAFIVCVELSNVKQLSLVHSDAGG